MLGRTPPGIEVVRPLCGGVISRYDVTSRMLQHFLAKSMRQYHYKAQSYGLYSKQHY